jgi:uroporphyrinogen decarboxylase-like protein
MAMSHRERILRTFEHKSIDKIVWQPRIMYWYRGNKVWALNSETYPQVEKFVPKEWIGIDIMDLYEDLNASIRYPAETLSISIFNQNYVKDHGIKRTSTMLDDGASFSKISTPAGEVFEKKRNGYPVEHMVKKIEDLKVARYLVEKSEFNFTPLSYELAEEVMEDFGLPTAYYFRSPYMKCVLEFLGFEKTIIFLRRYKREMAEFMDFLAEWDLKQYKNVICKSPVKLLNFGENIDHNLSPPRYLEKYLLPYWEERVKLLKNANKLSFMHLDGSFKDLLPYLKDLPFDGIEALTPRPQGDVTLDELYNAVHDSGKILLDVIPATLFMPQFSEERFRKDTQEILEKFAPNLILGVSDELPPNADGRRLKIVSELVEKFDIR